MSGYDGGRSPAYLDGSSNDHTMDVVCDCGARTPVDIYDKSIIIREVEPGKGAFGVTCVGCLRYHAMTIRMAPQFNPQDRP